ncbi:MAG TPA: zinc-dependent peptidase [Bacteroidales bacterium]|nr:zinc-dependent peptidase [Bacteroidales bacterium]
MIIHYCLFGIILNQTLDGGAVILAVVVIFISITLFKQNQYNKRLNNTRTLNKNSTDFTFNIFRSNRKMPPSGYRFLADNFEFYRKFSPKQQKLFAARTIKFVYDKNFEGRDGQQVSFEMKVLIAATAIRLTWGLKYYLFPSFHSILIYPGEFYSGFSKAVVKGETNMAGVVVFSWKDFLFGVSDQNDNLNLGYHEFGHALFVERFKETMDDVFIDNYDRWRRLIISKGKLKEAELKHTFRQYATYNEHEFFAVAVENFFERPEKFKNDLPKLYNLMATMLNQDPLASVHRYDQRSF